LRGVDAPELKASCPQELQMAEAAGEALRNLLGEGEVTIYNIGPDKYNGRVVADIATRRTDNVSAALVARVRAQLWRRAASAGVRMFSTKEPRGSAALCSSFRTSASTRISRFGFAARAPE
jgi:endonuclease YncB( thermonuclease family)